MRELVIEILRLLQAVGVWAGQEIRYTPGDLLREHNRMVDRLIEESKTPAQKRAEFERARDRAIRAEQTARVTRQQSGPAYGVDFQGKPRQRVRFE